MTDDKLLSCPFCNSNAYVQGSAWIVRHKLNCFLGSPHEKAITFIAITKRQIKSWNTRSLYKMEDEYLHKWVVFQSSSNFIKNYLKRITVVFCCKETDKQIKGVENKNDAGMLRQEYTVHKNSILGIVPENKVSDVRNFAMNIDNLYNEKTKQLHKSFQESMLNFPHKIK